MLIRGEALIDTITLAFTISGKRGEWIGDDHGTGRRSQTEDETVERDLVSALSIEMLATAFESANRRRFPERQTVEADAMTAVDDFWDALSFLLRPDDPAHNAAMIRDFAKVSGISRGNCPGEA